VKILEVNKNNLKQWGIDLSNYAVGATLSPTGAENELAGGFTNVRATLLSSLSRADWVVSVPSTVFARFLETESTVRLLSAPRLRAAEGKKAELKVGTEVPVPVTTFAAAGGGIGTFAPATSFQYRNVGVNLVITPEISASGDITLEVIAEFSILGDDRAVSSGENALVVPTFLTRNVTNVIRLRDGETGLIGGLLEGSQASSVSGALGLSTLPIIGKLFGNNQKRVEEKEVIISLTPRIVRAPKVTESDLVPMPVGTQAVPRVEGASPGLFGPEPETTPPAPAARSGSAPAARTPTPAPAPVVSPQSLRPKPVPQGGFPPPPGAGPAGAFPPPAPPAPVVDVAEAEAGAVSVRLSPPELALEPGETGGLAVVLVGAQDLEWVELELSWDGAVAEMSDARAGSLLTIDGVPVAAARTLESGRARVRFTRPAGTSGSGAVAALTFRGLAPGSATLVVESVAVGKAGATVPLVPPPPGRIVVAE
jgi:general secretion pathway protein D